MAGARVTDQAFVTLAATEEYALGAMVLAFSLRDARTTRQLVCMVTDRISTEIREHLAESFDEVVAVAALDSDGGATLDRLRRPELGITFAKLFCWTLTQYRKAVFVDADTLALCSLDELFEREELSAAPDVGWPDCFNSGVFVYRPSLETFAKLVEFAKTNDSFDGGDQGLLNCFFSDWATADIGRRLPIGFNLHPTLCTGYPSAYSKFGHLTKLVHFIGPGKPWLWARNEEGEVVVAADQAPPGADYVRRWWRMLESHRPGCDPAMYGVRATGTGGFQTTWLAGEAHHTTSQPYAKAKGSPPTGTPPRVAKFAEGNEDSVPVDLNTGSV